MTLERDAHRKMAAECFNEAWKLLDKRRRTPAEDKEMLHLVHASRYHWGIAGGPRNVAVGDWQVSRAYASLGEGRLSLAYASSSLEVCRKEKLRELLPSALEGVARAYAALGDAKSAKRYLSKASEALESSGVDQEDRKIYESQMQDTMRIIGSPRAKG